jgi:hypothetical protein
MSKDMNKLKERINEAIRLHSDKKERWKAMQAIKWRLFSHQLGFWAGLRGVEIVPVTDPSEAMAFDARDNEEQKLAYYRAATGIQWEIELI